MRANVRCSLLALFAVLSSVVLGTTPSAAAEPEGGCAPPFQLMTVEETIELAIEFNAPGFEEIIQSGDRNGDNLLCVKLFKNVPATFIFIDNHVQGGRRP